MSAAPSLLDGLLAPPIAAAERSLLAATETMLARDEEAAIARAVPARRREFMAGRACAREAMARLGLEGATVPAGPDRAPIWPGDLVGSISHTATHCAAIVARRADGFAGLGLDLEIAAPIEDDLLGAICTDAERAWLDRQPADKRGLMARAIFSAKEAAYKAQYALSRRLLDFHAMEIAFSGEDFTARFREDAAPFACGDALHGRMRRAADHIVTVVTIPTPST